MVFSRSILSLVIAAVAASAPNPVPVPYPVIVNGRPLANATMVNGALAISLDDFARAVGADVVTEGARVALRFRPGRQKPGRITITRNFTVAPEVFGGRRYVRLSDIATAFGGSLAIQGNLAPGAPINLTFAPNPNAALQTQ
jgi:hypothetical protein